MEVVIQVFFLKKTSTCRLPQKVKHVAQEMSLSNLTVMSIFFNDEFHTLINNYALNICTYPVSDKNLEISLAESNTVLNDVMLSTHLTLLMCFVHVTYPPYIKLPWNLPTTHRQYTVFTWPCMGFHNWPHNASDNIINRLDAPLSKSDIYRDYKFVVFERTVGRINSLFRHLEG